MDAKHSMINIQIMVAKPQYSNTRNSPSAKTSSTFPNQRVPCHSHSLSANFVKKCTQIRFRSRNTSVAEFSTPNIDVQSVTRFSAVQRTSHRIVDGIDLAHHMRRSQPRHKRHLRAINQRITLNPALKKAKSTLRQRNPIARERRVRLEAIKDSLYVKCATKHSDARLTYENI